MANHIREVVWGLLKLGQILCKYVCAADKYSEFAFRLYAYKRSGTEADSFVLRPELLRTQSWGNSVYFFYRGYFNPLVLCDSNTCLAVFYREICGRIFTKLPYKDTEKHMTATYGRLSHSRHVAPLRNDVLLVTQPFFFEWRHGTCFVAYPHNFELLLLGLSKDCEQKKKNPLQIIP